MSAIKSLGRSPFVRLLPNGRPVTFTLMALIAKVQKLALDLPEIQHAVLAANLFGSLSPVVDDEDKGIAQAVQRDAQLDANPAMGIPWKRLIDRFRVDETDAISGPSINVFFVVPDNSIR
jgi:hypothetical protein